MTTPTPTAAAPTVLITVAAFVVVVAGMKSAQPIIVPFLLSVFIAVISAPPLFWLEDRGWPRALAMLAVIAGIVAAGSALTLVVGTSIRDFSRDLPIYKQRLNDSASGLLEWLQARGLEISAQDVFGYVDPGSAIQLAADVFDGFGGVLANAFLIFLTVVFILFETSSFPAKLHAVVDDPEHSLGRFAQFSMNLRRYLAIKTMASVGTGVCIGAWLWFIGVDYPVLWGILAFMLNYVPNIGSIIAAVPAVLLAFVQLGPGAAVSTALGFLVVNIVFGNVIEPRYMGRGLGLSTLVVFLSLVFWGWLLGPVGMFLSVPLTMTAKIALDSQEETRWLAVMLGDASAARFVAQRESDSGGGRDAGDAQAAGATGKPAPVDDAASDTTGQRPPG